MAERALRRIELAIENTDDSDGYLGDLLRRFEEIHLDACRVAKPNPVELAQRMFAWELDGPFDVFRGAAQRYADVLGAEGLAEYRRLAEAEWERVPVRDPSADAFAGALSAPAHEFAVTVVMESLAKASGDADELVEVMGRDLSSPYKFLRIARVYRENGRDDEAIDWGERCVAAFPTRSDIRVQEFLADAYLDRSRNDEAMALIWPAFVERPGLESYQRLMRYAERADARPAWRSRAIEDLKKGRAAAGSDGSTLVSIYSWEGEFDTAWDTANELGCNGYELLHLAKQSESTRPADALVIFQGEVEDVLRTAGRPSYTTAIGLLRRIQRLMAKLDRGAVFQEYAAQVREANSRRPAFLSMFDAAGFLP